MGVYVTIYGRGFGQARGSSTVTIGDGEAAAYPIWTDTKIAFQLGPQARTGNIVVHTSAGASNGVPFTVREGRIYFVAPGGKDGSSGEFGNPWRTIQYAIQTIAPGDTVYAMDGVTESRPGSSDGSVEIASSGMPGRPKTLAAYPGATVTIGSPGSGVCNSVNCVEGLVTFNVDTPYNYWTIAGLKLRGNNMAFEVTGGRRPYNLSTNWRVVGNDMSCPYIHSESGPGCVTFSEAQYIQFYGNTIHDVGQPGDAVQEYGQGLYFTTDTIHVDAGWNTVANIKGCRGIQVHSSPLGNGDRSDPTGYNQYDISIHDNLIHDCACDGLLFWSVDPSQGPVKAYNNVIYNAGNGPKPPSGSGFFSCIYMAAVSNNAGAPRASGIVDVASNTLYNCGILGSPDVSMAVRSGSDSSNTNIALRLQNNIIDVAPGQIYTGGNSNPLSGSKNLWFGAGPAPANGGRVNLADNLNADPLFVNAANANFHLQPKSPARDAGAYIGLASDKDGAPRPAQHVDLGAYQYAAVRVASLSCQPAIIVTPATISCSVALTAGAVEDNASIEIRVDNPNVTTDSTLPLPADGAAVSLQVKVNSVAVAQNAVISAGTDPASQVSAVLTLLPPSSPAMFALSSSATFRVGPVSPGELVSVFGVDLGPATPAPAQLDMHGNLMSSLAGTTPRFDGVPAPLLWVQTYQVNAMVPFSVAGAHTTNVELQSNGATSNVLAVPVVLTHPAVFAGGWMGTGQAVALNEDGTLNAPGSPAPAGSTLTLFATGLGQTDPASADGQVAWGIPPKPVANVSLQLGGLDSELLYVGAAPGQVAGLMKISARVPNGPAGASVPLVLRAGEASSQPAVVVAVK